MYLSVPISPYERVEFNAHRIFKLDTIIELALANKLQLKKCYTINKNGWQEFPKYDYLQHYEGLALFIFSKI